MANQQNMPDIIGKSPTQRTKPNYFYTISSVAMVLFLVGFFSVLFSLSQQLGQLLKERVSILVEIEPESNPLEVDSLIHTIQSDRMTKSESVLLISKEAALATLQEEFGEDLLRLDLPNPLYDVITFNVKAAYMTSEQLEALRHKLKSERFVKDVYYQEGLVHQIVSNIQNFSWLFLILGCLFLLITITLIHNTIRLALYANRFVIKNMELVGATWKFISRPYIKRSILHGIISALIAILLLICLLLWADRYLPGITTLSSSFSLIGIALGLLLLGILINGLSTYFVINKYLSRRLDDLY